MDRHKRVSKVICNTSKGSLFVVLYEDIKKRIWDPKSKENLMNLLNPTFEWRMNRATDMIEKITSNKE